MMKKSGIILIFCLMASAGIFASHPFATDDTGTVDPDMFELELAITMVFL